MQKGCKRKYFFDTFYKILFFVDCVNIFIPTERASARVKT